MSYSLLSKFYKSVNSGSRLTHSRNPSLTAAAHKWLPSSLFLTFTAVFASVNHHLHHHLQCLRHLHHPCSSPSLTNTTIIATTSTSTFIFISYITSTFTGSQLPLPLPPPMLCYLHYHFLHTIIITSNFTSTDFISFFTPTTAPLSSLPLLPSPPPLLSLPLLSSPLLLPCLILTRQRHHYDHCSLFLLPLSLVPSLHYYQIFLNCFRVPTFDTEHRNLISGPCP